VHNPDETRAREALHAAYARFSQTEIARELDTDEKTLTRWVVGTIPRPRLVWHAVSNLLRNVPVPVEATGSGQFTFTDLFAGIGGTRLGFERAGGRCVFTSEHDRFCVKTYRTNFRPDHEVMGDIRRVDPASMPDHDVLVAGFPCQPFSIAGVSKKKALGQAHGFECETQGTLFFDVCRIIDKKRPLAFVLENVRNLKSHDGGRTFRVIVDSLQELGYFFDYRVIDARSWVPQHRERIFIVGFRDATAFTMDQVKIPEGLPPKLDRVLHAEDGREEAEVEYTRGRLASVNPKYTLTTHLWRYLQDYAKKHREAGNGFGFGLVTREDVARTLSARYFKDGSEILVSRGPRKNPRRLTPRECARLMGFPDTFSIPVSDTQAYKQFGNAVVVPVVTAVAEAMKPHVLALKAQQTNQQLAMVV
jgi:DNA (cytosine-5)-methyltransferase 1